MPNKISLRTVAEDLEILFRFQLDKEAQRLAAFMLINAADKRLISLNMPVF